MKKHVKSLALAGALGATLALGMVIGVAVADQPRMQAALDELQAARNDLQNATTDKGGHRVSAIRYVNLAIDETRAGMEYDRYNGPRRRWR